ncbi:AraC family transcriptional regulator [Dokdonella sp.]|uniref:helix-turn-helix transcriptional regulator n=1 Tax=Dokdonella sp. TaxID=2291710 RepID=UPI002F3E82C2
MSNPAFTRLCRARDFLRETCAENPPLAQAAAVANMSLFHFVRRFDALFGLTPHRWRTQARIRQARELLARGDHSVTDTCIELGFSSAGSFSNLFRRHVGMSPREFQRIAHCSVAVSGWPPPAHFPGCLSLMARLPVGALRNSR